MYGVIKAATASLLMPLPVLAAVFVLGWAFLRGRSRTAVCGLAVFGVLLLSWAPTADRMVATLEGRYLPLSEVGADTEVAAVVVLGGGWNPLAAGPASLRWEASSSEDIMTRRSG